MHKFIKLLLAAFLLAAALPFGQALAMMPILSTAELSPGMLGVARTVMHGSDIVTFDVEILGVEGNGKGAHEQILARASGPIVDQAGGIIHGMSGSPVYVSGKLVGAVARGIATETDPHVFYITPIEDMLKIWDMTDNKNNTKVKQVDLKAALAKADAAQPATLQAAAAEETKAAEPAGTAEAAADNRKAASFAAPQQVYPVSTPLLVSGFTEAGLGFLKDKLAPFSLVPYSGGAASAAFGSVKRNATLEPGSSVGAALVYGDFTAGATGTVTAVDGSRILAFGHPYTYRGNVNYFMTDATVIGSAGSLTNGTKVSSFGNIIGRINQDRYAGISGILGSFPSVVPIQVAVCDAQTGKKETYNSQIAYDEDLLPNMSAAIAYASIDKALDRQAAGSAKFAFEITTNAVPGGKLVRSNMYYNGADVGPLAVAELGQALDIICRNDEKEADILGVKVRIDIDTQRQTASLLEAVPDKMKVKPGETVNLKVKLKPYRRPAETISVPYTVPSSQAAGPLNLELRGGGLIPLAQLLLQQPGILIGAEAEVKQPLAEKIKEFLAGDKNNEIIISPAAVVAPLLTEKEQMEAIQQAMKQSQQLEDGSQNKQATAAKEDKSRFATQYIIDNLTHVSLQVEKKA